MRTSQLSYMAALIASLFCASNLYAANGIHPTNVKISEVMPKKLDIYKSYIGHVKPQDRTMVRSETSGTVEKIHVDQGEKVKAGQVLVHISTKELELKKVIAQTNYNQAVSDYKVEQKLYLKAETENGSAAGSTSEHVNLKKLELQAKLAKADYEHARNEYEVQKRLFEKSMTSAVSFDSYRTTLEIKQITRQQAELELKQANIKDQFHLQNYENSIKISEMNLKLTELELEKSKVKAPFSGIVKEKTVQPGGFIQSGTDLLEIMDISRVLVRINIPEQEMRFVAVGKPVSVRLDAIPGEEFEGTVKTLGLEADLKCRCFPADVLINNNQQKLLPGMMARIEMLAVTEANQVIIPRHAVLERQRGSLVFVAKNGIAIQVPVVTGEMTGEDVQILEGLNPGDLLIVVGQDLLVNNEPVNIINKDQKVARK